MVNPFLVVIFECEAEGFKARQALTRMMLMLGRGHPDREEDRQKASVLAAMWDQARGPVNYDNLKQYALDFAKEPDNAGIMAYWREIHRLSLAEAERQDPHEAESTARFVALAEEYQNG